MYNAGIHTYGENFKLKFCKCVQSMALGTRIEFQLELLIRSTISAIQNFEKIFWGAREILVKYPQDPTQCAVCCVRFKWAKKAWTLFSQIILFVLSYTFSCVVSAKIYCGIVI